MFQLTLQRAYARLPALLIGVLVVLNLLLAFAFQWYILVVIGPGTLTDGLVASMILPQFVLSIVTGPLLNVFVPVLAPQDPERARADTWTALHGLGFGALALATLLAMTAQLWVPIVVPGFAPETTRLTITLTRISMASLVLNLLVVVTWCYYRSQGRFVQVEINTLLGNLAGLIALVVVLPRGGVVGAALVMAARPLLQFVLLLPGLGRYLVPDWHSPSLGTAWRRALPMLAGASFYKVTYVTDRAFASLAPASSLSLFSLGIQLYGSVEQVIAKSLVAPMVPRMARLAEAGEWTQFKRVYWRHFFEILGLMLMGLLAIVLVGQAALHLLVGHGNVTDENVQLLWLILVALGGQLVVSPAATVLNAACYTRGETITPTIIGAAATVIGIGLRFAGLQWFGIVGLALGVSAQYALALAVLIPTTILQGARQLKPEGSTRDSHD